MIDRDLVPATFISPGAVNFSLLVFLERGTPSCSTEVPPGRCRAPRGCPGRRRCASHRGPSPPLRAQLRGLRISLASHTNTHPHVRLSVGTPERKVHLANLTNLPPFLSPLLSIIKSAPAMSGGQQIIKCGTFETAQPRENRCN